MDLPGIKYWPFNKGRDGCRSPMQWDDSVNAGFSKTKPWLPVHPNYKKRNVANQQNNENSVFNFTRRLIALRKEHKTLRHGEIIPLMDMPKDVMAYLRKSDAEEILVLLNFSKRKQKITLPKGSWEIFFSETRETTVKNELLLAPHEVLLLKSE